MIPNPPFSALYLATGLRPSLPHLGSPAYPYPAASPTPIIASLTETLTILTHLLPSRLSQLLPALTFTLPLTPPTILGAAIALFWQLYPVIRLAIYLEAVRNRSRNGVPQYNHTFKRSRKIVWVLPVHIAGGILQLVLSEFRRVGLLNPGVTEADLVLAVLWGYTGLRLVKPLRRGHPPSTRAAYQLISLLRPTLEYLSYRTGNGEFYRLSTAYLDTFIWVRVQLMIFNDWKWFDRAWQYTIAIPFSAVISLLLSGFSRFLILTAIAIMGVMAFNDIVSKITWKRKQLAKTESLVLKFVFLPFDIVLRVLLILGFADLETLRATVHRTTPEFTAEVDDDYGYVPERLIKGVDEKKRK